MKVIFAGPSIFGLEIDWTGLTCQPPAAFGDIARAVDAGARSIGLIDGYFGWTPSVWHKEILYALDRGVTVMGASSLGALRAAECRRYGMIPVGQIAAWYCDGILDDDGDVALLHYPAEAGYAPYTEALVDARATFDRLLQLELVTATEHADLHAAAAAIPFRERTVEHLLGSALATERAETVHAAYRAHRVSLKASDALTLVSAIRTMPAPLGEVAAWTLTPSFTWERAAY